MDKKTETPRTGASTVTINCFFVNGQLSTLAFLLKKYTFVVEMQNRRQANFKERALYYLSRALSEQGRRGKAWQYETKAVYGVFFMIKTNAPARQISNVGYLY